MTDCAHGNGFSGMRKTDLTEDAICFACESCGATFVADRCVGLNQKSRKGERCQQPAASGDTVCRVHVGQRYAE